MSENFLHQVLNDYKVIQSVLNDKIQPSKFKEKIDFTTQFMTLATSHLTMEGALSSCRKKKEF